MEQPVPSDIQAEQGVLGSLLIDPHAMERVADILVPRDFYRDAHCTIYEAMCSLYNRAYAPDFITLCDELERTGKLAEAGGIGYITSLVNEVPTSAHVDYYARIVARTAVCRRLIYAAGEIAALAYAQDEQALEKSEQVLYTLTQGKTSASTFIGLPDLMDAYMQELEQLHAHRGTLLGVPSGFSDIDAITSGWQKTNLVVLAGRPGSGKTSLAMNLAYNAATHDKGVAVFSLEMGERQLARRLLAMESGVGIHELRSGWFEQEQWTPIKEAMRRLKRLNIHINDTGGNPLASMRSQLRRLRTQTHIDLVIVDYLQLIEPGEDENKRINREQEIGKISRGLKKLAKDFDVPVIALAQLSREVEKRASKRPMLSDLRESGSIENDADIVLFVYREDYYAQLEGREDYTPTNTADIIIGKHRDGEVGEVRLYFKAGQTKFQTLTTEWEDR